MRQGYEFDKIIFDKGAVTFSNNWQTLVQRGSPFEQWNISYSINQFVKFKEFLLKKK